MSNYDLFCLALTAIGFIFILIAILIIIGLSDNHAEQSDNQELYRKG